MEAAATETIVIVVLQTVTSYLSPEVVAAIVTIATVIIYREEVEVVAVVAEAVETGTTVLAVVIATQPTAMAGLASMAVEGVVGQAQDLLLTTTGSEVDPLDLDVMVAAQVTLTITEDVADADEAAKTGMEATKRESHNLSSSTPLSISDWTHPGSSTSFGRS